MKRLILTLLLSLITSSSWAVVPLTEKDWQLLKQFARGGGGSGVASGATFPGSPTISIFLLTSDDINGDCVQGSGTTVTPCFWNGSAWIPISNNVIETLQTVTTRGNTSTGNDETNPLEIFGTGGEVANGGQLFQHSSGEFFVKCKPAGGLNKCNYYRQIDAGFKAGYKDSGNNIDFEYDEATGKITVLTMNTEDAGVAVTQKRYKYFSMGGCNAGVPNPVWELPVTNPAVANCRTGTNTTKGVLEFADGANALSAQLHDYLNEDWTGAIDATVIWQSGSTSTNNVVWQLAIACAGDGVSDDPAFTPTVFAADANKATANQYNLTAATTITTTGTCAANKIMHIKLIRDPANASDTLAATAQAVGLSLKLREIQ